MESCRSQRIEEIRLTSPLTAVSVKPDEPPKGRISEKALMSHAWRYDRDMPIDTVLRRWPSAISVLIRHRMLCVGCPIGTFHTTPEICAAHEVDEARFVRELEAAIAASAKIREQEDVASAL